MTETISISAELERFYSKPFKFSYSSLNKLLYSPRSFYNWYILGEKTDSLEVYLLEGSAIHCLLLEGKEFSSKFSILPGDLPTATNKRAVEGMYKAWKRESSPDKTLLEYSVDILDWLIADNTHQSLKDDKDMSKPGAKTADTKRLDKILTPQCNEYFDYLKTSDTKLVIDQEMYDRCEASVKAVRGNPEISQLLRLTKSDFELSEQVYNEVMLEMDVEGLPFGFKGIVDNLVVDSENKKVYINDLKTTSKSISEFPDSVEYYKYWMQAAIYSRLVYDFLAKQGIPDLERDWELIFHFVVIDRYNMMYPFKVSTKTLSDWQQGFDEVIETAKYHYTKKDFTLPHKFAVGQVQL